MTRTVLWLTIGLAALGGAAQAQTTLRDIQARNAAAQPGDVLVLGKPLGVGIYSAALKKEKLGADGYAHMIGATTRLNTPGPALAALPGAR